MWPPSIVFASCRASVVFQADLTSSRGMAVHIGAILGPQTRALVEKMRTDPRQHDDAGADGEHEAGYAGNGT